jgi:hypothetical protein
MTTKEKQDANHIDVAKVLIDAGYKKGRKDPFLYSVKHLFGDTYRVIATGNFRGMPVESSSLTFAHKASGTPSP